MSGEVGMTWELTDERHGAFTERVDRSGGPDACWPWTRGSFPKGYGSFFLDGGDVGAHRVALGLHLGIDPRTLFVRHTCDNPPCCNPAHLIAGDAASNAADAVERGRTLQGSRHHAAKLDEASVAAIRLRRGMGESVSAVARAFGVSRRTIRFIDIRKTWRHVP